MNKLLAYILNPTYNPHHIADADEEELLFIARTIKLTYLVNDTDVIKFFKRNENLTSDVLDVLTRRVLPNLNRRDPQTMKYYTWPPCYNLLVSIITSPQVSHGTLRQLSKSRDNSLAIVAQYALNEVSIDSIINMRSEIGLDGIITMLNSEMTDKEKALLISASPKSISTLFNHITVTNEILTEMHNIQIDDVQLAVAAYPTTTTDILSDMIYSPNQYTRAAVAEHPNTTDNMIEALYKDDSILVRAAIATNPNTPADIIYKYANESIFGMQDAISDNPSITTALLQSLSKDINDDGQTTDIARKALRHLNRRSNI